MKIKRTGWLQLPSKLRIDPELGNAVRAIAEKNYRTIQAQILLWLEQSVEREKVELGGDLRGSGPKVVGGKERREQKA